MSNNVELSPNDIFLLAKTSIGVLLIMITFEVVKDQFLPTTTLLVSHILTIFFVTVSFLIFFNIFLHWVAKQRDTIQNETNKNEERYLALTDNISFAAFRTVSNSEGQILSSNLFGLKMFDLSDADLRSVKIRDLCKDPKRADELVKKILQNGIVKNEEVEFKTLKGRVFWGQISALVKKDQNNQTYLEGYIQDISDIKDFQEKLNSVTQELKKLKKE